MKERKFEFLCENISQISKAIESEFLKEVSQLETDVHSIQMECRRIQKYMPKLSRALTSVSIEISQILGKVWEAKELPMMKGSMALLKAWPEDLPIIRRMITIIDRAILVEEKARLRMYLNGLLTHCIEPIRDETRRYTSRLIKK